MEGQKQLNAFGKWYDSLNRINKKLFLIELEKLCSTDLFKQSYANARQYISVTAIYTPMSKLNLIYYLAAIQCGFSLENVKIDETNDEILATQLKLSKA